MANTSILRTVFLETRHSKGQFVQVILKNSKPSVLSIHASEDKVLELVDRSGLQPFDEFRVPHRLTTMQYSPTELLLKLDISHAIIDGHSAELIFKTLSAAYFGLDDRPEELPYWKYVEHQSLRDTAESHSYWSQYLAEAEPSQVPVTTDQPIFKDLETFGFQLEIPQATLMQFQKNYNATIANACQVAWGLVLKCLLGKNNVCFSFISAASHIPLKGIIEAISPYITTLVCNLKLPEASECASQQYVSAPIW